MPRAISGSRAKLFVDDVEVGFCGHVGGTETQMLSRVDVLGDLYSKEIVPTHRVVSLNMSHVRIKRGSIKGLGLMAKGSTQTILDFPPMTAVIYDTLEDEPIETVTGLVAESRTWNVDPAGLFMEQASFQGIRSIVEDEE